jgi:D-glycero-alpha-D-manno-heptose-7-phosphate kinase
MLIVRSPVRISFAGGGTDLPAYFERFGGAVLSAAIDKYFYTIVGKRSDAHIQIISSDLRVFETWEDIHSMNARGTPLEIPVAVLKELGCEKAVDVFLASEIPPGTGLGSSASVCVNVLQAVATYLHLPLSKTELAEKAYYIATSVLGQPVGKQDEYAAAFGGLNFMAFNRDGSTEIEPLTLEPEFLTAVQQKLMLFFTGAAHHSWSILKHQAAATQSGEQTALDSLHRMKALVREMYEALLARDSESFGQLLHEGWESKKKLSSGISSPAIDRLYEIARTQGASGGKITGAGGGGFLLLFCHEEFQPAVRRALAAEGIKEMRFTFDFQGCRVLIDDPFLDADGNGAPQSAATAATPAVRPGRALLPICADD